MMVLQASLKMMVLLSESSDFGVPFGWILKSFEWEIYDLATQEPHERKTRSDCNVIVEYGNQPVVRLFRV